MARSISMEDDAPVYRAVINLPQRGQLKPYTKYEGPYASPGAAKARVTFWINHYGDRFENPVTGHVEQAVCNWGPLS